MSICLYMSIYIDYVYIYRMPNNNVISARVEAGMKKNLLSFYDFHNN
jgi:hypothetical protein